MSFNKDANNSDENPLTNQEIKTILLNVYDRLTKPSTKEVGYDLFLKLILKHLYNPSSMSYIISQLAEFIPPLPPKEKEPTLSLLSLIFFDPMADPQSPKKKTIYFQYLSLVLSIIQSITSDKNNSIFGQIANTYAEIVQNIMPTDINYALEDIDMEERKGYEMLQGFCIYNMKQEEKANRIVGSLCLTKLVENCPVVLQDKYTLYKVLDFLSEDDSNKKKLALNVIYTLIFYCKEEILPLKEHIVNFLRVLKTDKVKEISEHTLDICDSNKEVIASDLSIPNKKTLMHRASKGKTYYLRIRGTEGQSYTISYKMKSLDTMKFAKKYSYIFTNASFTDEKNALLFKIKANQSGILHFMCQTDKGLNVKIVDSKKKALSDVFVVADHAFSGIGIKANKIIYVKVWRNEDADDNDSVTYVDDNGMSQGETNGTGDNGFQNKGIEGTTSLNNVKYQIRSVSTSNGASKGKAKTLSKGKFMETLVPAGKATTSWYKIKINKKQTLSITIESRMLQNKGNNLRLYICNSSGKKLNTNPIVIDGETTVVYKKKYIMNYPKTTFGTTAKFPEGTYYLRVESKTKLSSGSYRIRWK